MTTISQQAVAPPAASWQELFDRGTSEGISPEPAWLEFARRQAMAHFSEWGLPTVQDEEWRFTDLSALRQWPIRLAPEIPPPNLRVPDQLQAGSRTDAPLLVFVNGRFCPDLSRPPAASGPLSLAAAIRESHPDLERHLTRHALAESNALVALNTAFFHDGPFLVIRKNRGWDQPVQILHLSHSPEPGWAVHPRTLILAEPGSQAVVSERYASLDGSAAFVNPVTEVVLGQGAVLEHCRIQTDHETSIHIGTVQAAQSASSFWKSHVVSVGARLCRLNVQTRLAGEGAESLLNGLYLAQQDQVVDHHTLIDHASPQCASHEFYHGILAGRSQGVFNGKIHVRPGAQKTDAKQTNRNLLLSPQATVNTKPQLEIFADDVKCTHGATIGQLDEEPMFYLQSRGIGPEQAQQMLIHAFARQIVERVSVAEWRDLIDRQVMDRWLPRWREAGGRSGLALVSQARSV